ncbi:hypothetical protein PAMC26577_30735 [Caballeronia sordidicola]|uniref:Uncharacterized protein n=1 Tax=Caballeronia sordidicola TaxID=196367 RepID=A0A242MDQ5_CABSO|nr:hypothetical protein PAMC26577_30735 [Caballeronia sordidicola]
MFASPRTTAITYVFLRIVPDRCIVVLFCNVRKSLSPEKRTARRLE